MKQENQVLNIVDNMQDFDYKALYPSTCIQNNMGPNTQIGKVLIDRKIYQDENPFKNPFYDRGGQFLEDYTSGDILEFTRRWLGFASYREVLDDIIEYFTLYAVSSNPIYIDGLCKGVTYQNNNLIHGVQYDNDLIKGVYYQPDKLQFDKYFDKRRLNVL